MLMRLQSKTRNLPTGVSVVALLLLVAVASFVVPPQLILTFFVGGIALVLGATVGLAVLTYPLLGMVGALLLAPFKGAEAIYLGGPLTTLSLGELALFGTIGVWLANSLLRRKIIIAKTPLSAPLFLFILMGMVSSWFARSPVDSLKEILKWALMLVIMWLIFDLSAEFPRRSVIYGLIIALLGAALCQASWGFYQFAIRGSGVGHFIIFGRFYRAIAGFMQPNPFGGYLNLNLCLALGVLVGFVRQKMVNRPQTRAQILHTIRANRPIALLTLITMLLFLALIGSWSRGAWLSFIVAMTIFAVFLPSQRRVGFRWAAIGLTTLFLLWNFNLVPPAIKTRFNNAFAVDLNFDPYHLRRLAIGPENYSSLERVAHWFAALGMARQSVWIGVGIGNYDANYDDHRLPAWEDALGHAHNIYLNTLAEMGIFGLLAYFYLWGSIFYYTIRAMRQPDPLLRNIALGLLAAWSSFSFHHLMDNLYVNNMYIHLGVMLTLLVLIQPNQDESPLLTL